MCYLVMECHPGYVILLDEAGRFWKAANFQYEVGQTISDPVLMRENTEKRRHVARWIGSGIAAVAACFVLFFGMQWYQAAMQPYSFIYLTINPEVRMDLNRRGSIVDLMGTNADGEKLLEGYDGTGKDKVVVTDELIDRAIEMGFLSEGGQVAIAIDTPEEVLFQAYGTEFRTGVTSHLEGRMEVELTIVNWKDAQDVQPPESSVPPTETQPVQEPQAPPAAVQPVMTPPVEVPQDSAYEDVEDVVNDAAGTSGYDGQTVYESQPEPVMPSEENGSDYDDRDSDDNDDDDDHDDDGDDDDNDGSDDD